MTTGTAAMNRVMLAIGGLPSVRVFRNNVALAWVGEAKRIGEGRVLITNARPLHAGLIKGSSDLIGWTSREITAADVGKRVAVFTAIEAKDGSGRLDKDQRRFIDAVRAAGGIAGEARSEEEARALVDGMGVGKPVACRP